MSGRQQPMSYHSPQQQVHQDSGVSFSTPSQDAGHMYHSPKDSGMVYQDAKVYQSPSQMQQMPHDQSGYQQSPLANATSGEDMNMHNLGMYGTIDPNSLGQPQQH